MKRILFSIALLAVFLTSVAQQSLRFNDNGEFKIVQFTDNHYKWNKGASKTTIQCIEEVLEWEHPDFVMFTGDLVYSDHVAQSIDAVLQPLIERNMPFAFVFGNHDCQFDMDHAQFYDHISSKPGCMMPPRGETESPDYIIEVTSSNNPISTSAVFYCLDSHAAAPKEGIGRYAWLTQSQILWYKALSDAMKEKNNGISIPALMFLHIPLPEVAYAYEDVNNYTIGTKGEKVCSPEMNSGMFCALKEQGDVYGVFFGHDHDNDYAVNYYDVLLAYGRYSGGKTVYNHLGSNGARVIVLKEGTKDIDSWIRLRTGETINPLSFPSEMQSQKKN